MPIYQYTATDQTGAQSQGTFEAPDEQQAQHNLLNMVFKFPNWFQWMDLLPQKVRLRPTKSLRRKSHPKINGKIIQEKKKGLTSNRDRWRSNKKKTYPFLQTNVDLLYKQDFLCFEASSHD